MTRVLKWIGIGVGSLLGLLLVAGVVLFFMGSARLNKTYSFPASNITISADVANIELGKHRARFYVRVVMAAISAASTIGSVPTCLGS